MIRKKNITSSKKEIRETKDVLINGYVITLVRMEENVHRPIPCFMGMWGWALKTEIKMKRIYKPCTKMKRTR